MNLSKLKKIAFWILWMCTVLLVILSILSIWEIIDDEIGMKLISTLFVISLSISFMLTMGQRLFASKKSIENK